MSYKPLAWTVEDEKVQVYGIPAFWAAMLAGRDTKAMVNMDVFMEEYHIPTPVMKNSTTFAMVEQLWVKLPFLTNSRELQKGELLVLPFDGGLTDIICENFPPSPAISHD